MHRAFIPNLLLAAQFIFSALSTPAQSSTSSSCPCTLRGSVVDSVSGQPVPHALVNLSGASPRAALTDSDGKFQFEGLPAGSVTLEAEKPGFLGQDPFARWYPTSAVIQLAPDSPPALLKLIPEGVIFGQVSDENGEPLEGFSVSLLFHAPQDRRIYPDPNQHHSVTTDDEGKFRIAGLHPGSYYLALHQTQEAVLSPSRKSAAPMGYAPVFYPGVNEMSSAVPLKVHPGTSIQANFSLKRIPFIRLSGTVSGYSRQEQMTVMLFDSGTRESPWISVDQATGAFQTKWVPPGIYILIAQSVGSVSVDAPRVPFIASQTVNATSDVSGIHLALQRAPEIPVIVHGLTKADSETMQAVPAVLALIPKGHPLLRYMAFAPRTITLGKQSEGDLHAAFGDALPGTYELEIAPQRDSPYYIESATSGSTDLLRNDLVLESSGSVPPIEVVLRDDGASLNGKVFSRGNPLPGVVVLLSDRRKKPIFLPVGSDGLFTVSSLAPGNYRVFAVESSANFDFEDPASLAKISSKIQEVTLSPKQSASINLEIATVEE